MRIDEFAGKNAVVTGAASGIGRAVAQMVTRHGGDVGCIDVDARGLRETKSLIAKESPDRMVKIAVADASEPKAVAVGLSAFNFDHIDLLFNVAGIIFIRPVQECTTEDLLMVMRANVGTVITTTAAVVPSMPRGGVVVNTSSSGALRVVVGGALYGASKESVAFITRNMANELNDAGIRVCAVGPGAVNTPMPRRAMAQLGITDFEGASRTVLEHSQLISELAQPEEIATTMGFLASSDARFCTGTTLWVDGGANAM